MKLKKLFTLAAALALPAVFTLNAQQAASGAAGGAANRPNVIVILADDYGYGSAVSYGGDAKLITTPAIDRLAREGMRFLDGNTPSSVCTPTRYALVTGRYCWRSRLNHGEVLGTTEPLLIETDRPTIASHLKARGYQTGFVGKWHLGYGTQRPVDYTQELKPGPLELGFDYQFAVPQNHNDQTRVFVENHRVAGLRSAKITKAEGKMGLDAPERDDPNTMGTLTDKAVAWLERQDTKKPFFLYFAPVAVHELVTPSAQTAGTTKAGPYGDFIRDLDLSVGRLLETLDKLKVADNTLVIFTSDNGGVVSASSKSGSQKTAMEAGLKINGLLRGGKHDVWQGGFQVPLVVRWPGQVKAGTTSRQMVGVVDIFATVAEAVDGKVPAAPAAAPDSVSFLAELRGQTGGKPVRQELICQSSDGVYALRSGPWKLIDGVPSDRGKLERNFPRKDQFKQMLFNLEKDPYETTDVAKENPKVVAELTHRLNQLRNQGHSR